MKPISSTPRARAVSTKGSTASNRCATSSRGELRAVQTPQAFVAAVLRAAVSGGDEATDCSSLVEARGGRVTVVEGDPRLLKVTTADDLALVESWLGSEP